jgi:hypothetical protein
MTTIINERPPIYDALRRAGMNFNEKYTIFTYGDAIYNPAGLTLLAETIAHEEHHMKQQREIEGGPDAWWDRFIRDAMWRIQQEAQAYKVQYDFVCKSKKSTTGRLHKLVAYAGILGGSAYGNVVTPQAALKIIQSSTV